MLFVGWLEGLIGKLGIQGYLAYTIISLKWFSIYNSVSKQ